MHDLKLKDKVMEMENKNEENFDVIKKRVDKWSFYSNYGVSADDKPILISKK